MLWLEVLVTEGFYKYRDIILQYNITKIKKTNTLKYFSGHNGNDSLEWTDLMLLKFILRITKDLLWKFKSSIKSELNKSKNGIATCLVNKYSKNSKQNGQGVPNPQLFRQSKRQEGFLVVHSESLSWQNDWQGPRDWQLDIRSPTPETVYISDLQGVVLLDATELLDSLSYV